MLRFATRSRRGARRGSRRGFLAMSLAAVLAARVDLRVLLDRQLRVRLWMISVFAVRSPYVRSASPHDGHHTRPPLACAIVVSPSPFYGWFLPNSPGGVLLTCE